MIDVIALILGELDLVQACTSLSSSLQWRGKASSMMKAVESIEFTLSLC